MTSASAAAAVAVGILVASLWPFDFSRPVVENGAQYRAGQGLTFSSPGAARTTGIPGLRELDDNGFVMLDLRVRSLAGEQSGPARILTVSPNLRERNFTVSQQGRNLDIRVRTPGSDPNGTVNGQPLLDVPEAFVSDRWVQLRLRIMPAAASVTMNGRTHERPLPSPPFDLWAADFPVTFGNEATNDRPWRGEIAQALACTPHGCTDLLAPDAIVLPKFLWIHYRPQLLPTREYELWDGLANVIGYIPLGIVLALVFRKPDGRPRIVTILACVVALSLTMEMLQVFLASRHPSIVDVIFNLTGGTIGLILAATTLPGRTRKADPHPPTP